MSWTSKKFLSGSALMALASITATPAWAADENVAQADPASDATTEGTDDAADVLPTEIVVVAQKRAERVQDVPLSIAAFGGEDLKSRNVTSVKDLGRVAPNFSVSRVMVTSSVRLTVRGIGAPGNSAIEPSVAAFLDGVYVPRPGAIINGFLDMESVEVLRGPQGTLFGRNASVGAVSLHSATPKNDFSAEISGEAGTGDRYKVGGYINVPVSDNVAVRVAGQQQWFKGYWHNDLDGRQYGGTDDTAVRASVKADLGNLTWLVRGDYARSTGTGYPSTDFDASSVSPAQLAALQNRLGGLLPDTVLGDRHSNQVIDAHVKDENWGVMSDASLDLNGYTLRLINSYRKWDNHQRDGDGGNLPVATLFRDSSYISDSHNHELQFISPKRALLGERLDFVAGLYYFQETFRTDEMFDLPTTFCSVVLPTALQPGCGAVLANGGGNNVSTLDFKQKLKSFAVYGQANFAITDTLELTLGGRWTTEKKNGYFDQVVANPIGALLRAPEHEDLRLKDDRFTYRAGLQYKPTSDMMLFASYSTGYKSGGFNSAGGTTALGQRRVFARETVENYELGAKTSWLDDALTVNATLYRMDIKGYQDRSFDGLNFNVRNAGNLRHQGVEFDMTIAPVRRFQVNASFAYLDSKFTDYRGASALPGLGGTQDLTGTRALFSPELSGTVGVKWTGDLGGTGATWELASDLSLVSDANIGFITDNNPQTVEDGYALLGARFAINGPDKRWTVAVFGNNLTGKDFSIARLYQVFDGLLGMRNGIFPGSTAVRAIEGEPRTIGVSGTVRF